MLTAPLLLELPLSLGTAGSVSLAACEVQSCCGYLSPMRPQMLVRMNTATAAGGARLLT